MWSGGVIDVVSVCSAVKVVMMNIQQFIIPMITAMHKGIGWGGWIGVGWDEVWVVVVQFCPGQLHHVHRGGWRWDGFFIVELAQLARPKPVKLSYRFHVVEDFERVVLKNRDQGFLKQAFNILKKKLPLRKTLAFEKISMKNYYICKKSW